MGNCDSTTAVKDQQQQQQQKQQLTVYINGAAGDLSAENNDAAAADWSSRFIDDIDSAHETDPDMSGDGFSTTKTSPLGPDENNQNRFSELGEEEEEEVSNKNKKSPPHAIAEPQQQQQEEEGEKQQQQQQEQPDADEAPATMPSSLSLPEVQAAAGADPSAAAAAAAAAQQSESESIAITPRSVDFDQIAGASGELLPPLLDEGGGNTSSSSFSTVGCGSSRASTAVPSVTGSSKSGSLGKSGEEEQEDLGEDIMSQMAEISDDDSAAIGSESGNNKTTMHRMSYPRRGSADDLLQLEAAAKAQEKKRFKYRYHAIASRFNVEDDVPELPTPRSNNTGAASSELQQHQQQAEDEAPRERPLADTSDTLTPAALPHVVDE